MLSFYCNWKVTDTHGILVIDYISDPLVYACKHFKNIETSLCNVSVNWGSSGSI